MLLTFEAVRERAAAAIRNARPYQLVLAGLAAMIVVAACLPAEVVIPILFVVLLGSLVLAWVRAFVELMSIEEDEFPGRSDKVIWALAILLLPPIGVPAFVAYRYNAAAVAKPAAGRDDLR